MSPAKEVDNTFSSDPLISISSRSLSFDFGERRIHAFERKGEAFFVANEVAAALGYSDTNQAIRKHCKGAEICKTVDLTLLGLRCDSPRGLTIIPERDVYRLVMRSKLPAAEAFEEKVVGEVLPAIRKTGGYNVAPRLRRPSVLRTFNTAMKIGERIGLESGQLAFHAAQYCKAKCGENPLELMGVKSLAAPRDEHTLTPRQIGQELGDISAQRVNQELLKLGFQSFTIDGKGHRVYHLTEAGKPFGRLEDTARAHTQGGVTVLRWYPGIINILGS